MLKWNPPVAVVWFFGIPFFHPKILAKIYFSASFGEVLSPFKARKTKGRSSFGGNVFFLKKIYFPFNFEGFLWKQSRIFCVHQQYLLGKTSHVFNPRLPNLIRETWWNHLQTPLQPCVGTPPHMVLPSHQEEHWEGKKGEKMEGKKTYHHQSNLTPKAWVTPNFIEINLLYFFGVFYQTLKCHGSRVKGIFWFIFISDVFTFYPIVFITI